MLPSQITEEMVAEKERANAQRREQLLRRQQSIVTAAEPAPNFPPECCCIKPVIYHNIHEQVPVPHQRFMYILCGLYLCLIVLIIYNIVASLVLFIFQGSAMHFGLSFLYLLGLPGAWMCWYYNVYCAVVYISRPRRLLGMLGLFFGVAFDVWMAIGVSGFGGCGWLVTIANSSHIVCLAMLMVAAILWTVHAVLLGAMFIRFWRFSGSLVTRSGAVYRETLV